MKNESGVKSHYPSNNNNYNEWLKSVEMFIKDSIYVILNNRKRYNNLKNTKEKICLPTHNFFIRPDSFLYINDSDVEKVNQHIDLDYSIDDEYKDLKVVNAYTNTNNKQITSPGISKIFDMQIIFKRKNVKFKVEIWKFIVVTNTYEKLIYRKTLLYKKLSVMIRTIMSTSKILPVYSLFMSKGFDFELDFEIISSKENITDNVSLTGYAFESMIFGNFSNNFGIIKLEILFLPKNKIFNIEEDLKKQIFIEENNNNLRLRPRFISNDEISIKNKIEDDFKSEFEIKTNDLNNNSNFDTIPEIKRSNSKSLYSKLNKVKKLNTIEITKKSFDLSFCYKSKDFFSYLTNTDDIIYKKLLVKQLEKVANEMGNTRCPRDNTSDELSFESESDDYDLNSFEDFELQVENEETETEIEIEMNNSSIRLGIGVSTDPVKNQSQVKLPTKLENLIHKFNKVKSVLNESNPTFNIFGLIAKMNIFSK